MPSRRPISEFHFLTGVNFISTGLTNALVLLLPFIASDLHLSLSAAGSLETARNAVGMAVSIPAAYLFSRIGGARMGGLGLFLSAVALLWVSHAQSYWVFLLAFLAYGAVQKPMTSMGMLMMGGSTSKNKGTLLGWYYAMGDIGKMGISAAAVFGASLLGWRNAASLVALLAGVFLIISAPLGLFHREKVTDIHASRSHVPWKQLLRHKPYLLGLALTFLDTVSSIAVFVFLNFLLLRRGVSPAVLGFFPGMFFFGLMSGRFVLGKSADRYGPDRTFLVLEVSMAILTTALVFTTWVPALLVVCFLLGVTSRGTTPVRQLIILETIESMAMKPDRAIGLNSVVSHLSVALAPLTLGFVGDRYGLETVYYVCGLMALLAIVPVVLIRRHNSLHLSIS